MIVLGIDPGTAVTGFGVVADGDPAIAVSSGVRSVAATSRMRLVECGVIRTRPRDALPSRLQEVYAAVCEIIARHRPDTLAVEGVFYARNIRTTLALGQARGVVLLAGVESGLTIREYSPTEIKKAVVGTGSATKEQVQFMLARLLHLRDAPHPTDAADGVAAALTCLLTGHVDRLRAALSMSAGTAPRTAGVARNTIAPKAVG